MSREWKSGDVAILALGKGGSVPVRAIRVNGCWVDKDGVSVEDIEPWSVRPLVVIDPEDREQVERLATALRLNFGDAAGVANALRELAKPTPPKPDEPTGLGAVVEVNGDRLVRFNSGTGWWWRNSKGENYRYGDLGGTVRVLSEGVSS